ncbi:unnamed protein product [Brassica oleracea]
MKVDGGMWRLKPGSSLRFNPLSFLKFSDLISSHRRMKPHHHTPFDTFARYHHHQQLISTIRHLSLSLCAVFISELPAARCNLVQLKSLFLDNNQVKHVEQLKRGFADIADDVYEILHEIGRDPPEPKGTIDSLVLLTQKFGRRAGDMNLMVLLHIEDCPDKEPLGHGFYAGSTMARFQSPSLSVVFCNEFISKRERRDGVCRWQRKEMTRRHHHHHRWLLSPPSPSLPSPIARHHHHCWCSIQGRHRHPASDSVVNEKYLNAGSGNDLTEENMRAGTPKCCS